MRTSIKVIESGESRVSFECMISNAIHVLVVCCSSSNLLIVKVQMASPWLEKI